jgi:nucleotide-binding universal stress UspA family protein
VPIGAHEAERLEQEHAAELQDLPRMERVLVYADDGANGHLTARLAGLFAARQQVLITVLEEPSSKVRWRVENAARSHLDEAAKSHSEEPGAAPRLMTAEQLVQAKPAPDADVIEREITKGYDMAYVGIEQPLAATEHRFDDRVQRLVSAFDGPVAVMVNAAAAAGPADQPLDILVPTTGRQDSWLATEIALALAHASRGTLTALHVFDPQDDTELLRGRARRPGISLLVDIHRLGKRSGVVVRGLTATNAKPEIEIRRAVRGGRFNLVVLGTSLRQGETKFLGSRMASLLRRIRTPALVIAR